MGWASERKAIESRFSTNWTTTPIKYEDVPFPETKAAYVEIVIRNGNRSQVTLGVDPTIRSISIIGVNIFVPKNTGTETPKTYADSIATIFDRVQFTTDDGDLISCQTASAEAVGQSDGWCQFNVTVPYTRDEN